MVITVTCPSCASTFPVDPAKIPEGGVNARCTKCDDIFRVEKPADAEPAFDLPAVTPAAPEPSAPFQASPSAPEPEPPATFEAPPPLPESESSATFEAPPPLPEPEVAATFEAPLPVSEHEAPAPADSHATEPTSEPEPTFAAPEPTPGFSDAPAGADPFAQAAPFEGSAPAAPADPAAPPADEPAVQGFTFGKRDPTDKAKRLARVLVSDMIMYNAERHQTALAQGTLVQDFEDEIQKSWKEYVEQVGEEMANGQGRTFWVSALNEILAKGQEVF